MKLNNEQLRAAKHVNGPILVLAGPGSGKTHLLVERIRMMIEDAGIPPESILVITFSNKAARQMQARFIKCIKGASYPVTFGTFHAVFYRILKEHDPDADRLITNREQTNFVKSLAKTSGLFDNDTDPEEIIGIISSYKNLADDFFVRNDRGRMMDDEKKQKLVKFVEDYGELCRKNRVVDFDDMILLCDRMFRRHESVLRKWKKRYRYFLVDEFQDINDAQYDILRLLAGDERNVFAVGDDDQSIYAFRGARPELMKKFLHQYIGCRQVTLTMNYRCCENVIGAADTLIRHNTQRLPRRMQRHLPSKAGGMVEIIYSENSELQAAFVCDMIKLLTDDEEYKPKEIAVLYRSEHCVAMFDRIARARGISDAINVMTVHASKGLEFRCVFIIGLQEGLFPHHKNMNGMCEEERRLMYVAMTRAKERLYMCGLGTEHGKRSSRFIIESMEKKRYINDVKRLKRI